MKLSVRVPARGRAIILTSWWGTAVFVLVEAVATLSPDAFGAVVTVVDFALFGLGIAAFFWAYAIAVSRSREDEISVIGLYLLQGCAPSEVRRALLAPLVVQTVVAIAAAALRVYSPLAFGVLVPMFGLGLAGLWAARHGEFPPRVRSTR